MSKPLLLLFLLLPFFCSAQFSITGKVINQADTKPVANVSVLLNNTTIGGKTENNGTFYLNNITAGKYNLIISIVGYETFTQTIDLNKNLNLSDIILFPKTTALNTVIVKVDRDREKNFDLYYERFKAQFLGRTEFAEYCKILNPEMLDFDYDETTNTLTASSADFLQIENDALGYKISYLLKTFKQNGNNNDFHYDGPALFIEMKGTPAQEQRWQQNRRAAYEGSVMQFLRSTLNDQLDENGFRVLQLATYANPERPTDSLIKAKLDLFANLYHNISKKPEYLDSIARWKKKSSLKKIVQALLPFPLYKQDFVASTNDQTTYALGCDSNKLLVMYNKDHQFIDHKKLSDLNNLKYLLNKVTNKDLTLLDFKTPNIFFDANGWIINTENLLYQGAWTKKRVADLLPIDYQSEQNKLILADSTVLNLKNKISSYSNKHVFEKIHLHLDRPRYGLGDTIWFKAYVLAGSDHLPSTVSTVMYSELFNQNDSLLTRLILPLDSGVTNGDFAIPTTYKAGTYRIRAYTNWMRNDSNYYFEEHINIGGLPPATSMAAKAMASKLQTVNQKNSVARPDVQFFPEGGDLINGLRSKVAFKVIGADGLPKDIQGVITDENGNEVAALKTQNLGMGEFPLTPQPGTQYKAKITFKDNSTTIYKLPEPKEKGFVLTVNNIGDSIYVKVAANNALFNSKLDTSFYLIAQSAGKIYYVAQPRVENEVFTTRIEKDRFPSGVIQFTLFSQSGEPLNERIIFVQNPDQLKLKVSLPAKSFAPQSKVKIDLNAANEDSNPITGSFSIAVTDETKVPVDEITENTIFTDLLLASELRGHIENPNYYFTNANDQTRSDLDLLMLTQGYRRFNWKKVLRDSNTPFKFPAEKSLSISGIITTPGDKPIANGKVQLTSVKDRFVMDTVSDANGNFTFTNINLPDTTKVVINAKNAKSGNKVKITLSKAVYPGVAKFSALSAGINDTSSAAVLNVMKQTYENSKQISFKNTTVLREVKIKSKRNEYFNPVYSQNMSYSVNLNGPGNANQVILGESLVACTNLAYCLATKTTGIWWKKGLPLNIRNMHTMTVIIDGAQRGTDAISKVDPNSVYSVEILTSVSYLSIYGSNAPNGLIIITMKRGSDFKPEPVDVDGLITYKINGYYKAREFYSPKYTLTDTHQLLDDRKTIYWNPNIITDVNGKASLGYFNAGGTGSYRVVVEGIDGYGNPGRQVLRYSVE